ncbi:MAG: ATP-binding protein, partial [Chitinophagaceae bacterium]
AGSSSGLIVISVEKSTLDVSVSVYNNGPGINPDEQEAIFDKFYQSENQNTNKPIGSGLGLAISKQIIEMHKGRIQVRNNQPAGVTFTFTLPL